MSKVEQAAETLKQAQERVAHVVSEVLEDDEILQAIAEVNRGECARLREVFKEWHDASQAFLSAVASGGAPS